VSALITILGLGLCFHCFWNLNDFGESLLFLLDYLCFLVFFEQYLCFLVNHYFSFLLLEIVCVD
jgi:hypothetical protein